MAKSEDFEPKLYEIKTIINFELSELTSVIWFYSTQDMMQALGGMAAILIITISLFGFLTIYNYIK